jgi:hypothetical protein
MSPRQKRRDVPVGREQDVFMASGKGGAAGAAWEGADLGRAMAGEDPASASLEDARHWVGVYSHLLNLEQELFDVLARMIPMMPSEAKKEAEETNLPVLASQLERFRHRLDLWSKRKRELEARQPRR